MIMAKRTRSTYGLHFCMKVELGYQRRRQSKMNIHTLIDDRGHIVNHPLNGFRTPLLGSIRPLVQFRCHSEPSRFSWQFFFFEGGLSFPTSSKWEESRRISGIYTTARLKKMGM